MSILGINPERDKLAKAVIYGGGYVFFALIKALALANVSNPVGIYKIWFEQSKLRKDIKDKAWNRYSETGDILGSLKEFITG